ncbi:maleamate amidohydrolase [Haladaptatus litoreus]|uniref:Maleamate amidohydrolase n=1 Tax=Haladaptatus litoreus TaxID=553468 RepID=A0A1N7F116_9EURY|nr:isochorismatase family protein [Haladaptatus litoreus]SIR93922.1 maleamate amidohydrolase [Haladaptatus litoreus]
MSDKERVYDDAGMVGHSHDFGDRPALLVVDLQNGETDPDEPIGSDLSNVIENTNELIDISHEQDVPVVFARVVYRHPDAIDGGLWVEKIPALKEWTAGSYPTKLDERLHVENDDHILDKRHASAFHDTELGSMLTAMGIDTLVVTGCSTSGCIRSSVDDAAAQGFRTIVPKECVGDRSTEQHEAHLWDIDAKFADVLSMTKVAKYFRSINATKPTDRA